jgi:hypothetical protein
MHQHAIQAVPSNVPLHDSAQLLQHGRALNKAAEGSDQYVTSALITVLPITGSIGRNIVSRSPRANRRWE